MTALTYDRRGGDQPGFKMASVDPGIGLDVEAEHGDFESKFLSRWKMHRAL